MAESFVIRRSDRVTQPWKNGGGITHELLREAPPAPGGVPLGGSARGSVGGAGRGFALRLSIAEVAADGPFSLFPGVDRVILMLEGNGFRLRGPQEVDVLRVAEPFAFAGEDPWDCALVDGPVRDFNVMVDRSVYRAEVEVTGGPARVDLGPRGFVLALEPGRFGGVALEREELLDTRGVVRLQGRAVVVRLSTA